jgi:hypothetical protein
MKVRMWGWVIVVAGVVGLLGAGAALADDGPGVEWWVIGGGGGAASGADVVVNDTVGQPVIGPASVNEDVALSAGYWVGCVAAAAVAPGVRVAVDWADVLLTWDADPANTAYQVWAATDPFFDPDAVAPVTVTGDTFYRDTGAAADLDNHYYVVRALNGCGAPSVGSARRGEFTFGVTAGTG